MVGHRARLGENRHLPLSRRSVLQKTCIVLNMEALVRALLTQEIMRSKDAQCNSRELP